ncbi:MAG: CsbD family protein [Methylococcales bacterium]|nr:CsbD family protein [Methylococcaceae bacterium]
MNKDQVKGHVDEAIGKVKEVTGNIINDDDLEIEGNVQKNVGKVQAKVGDIKEEIKKAL